MKRHITTMKYYALFHLNLMYSSIEAEQRSVVIQNCYWPLLHMIENGFPLSIEISGKSLEILNDLDPNWVSQFKRLLRENRCELVGSGYVQSIGPLQPYDVNNKNQKLGLQTYEAVLDIKPKIALVNEMAWSKGIVEHYVRNGYTAIIMDWNNALFNNIDWEPKQRFYPQQIKDNNGLAINIIWADSLAFQKLQRVIYGSISEKEYYHFIENSVNGYAGFFPLYSNDAEAFNFRAGRYHAEKMGDYPNDEWKKVEKIFNAFKDNIATISQLTKENEVHLKEEPLKIESPSLPILVKKQDKYNILRWALSGRNDLDINTRCFKTAHIFRKNKIVDNDEWKQLCYLWGSDFRTHITEKRWRKYLKQLNRFEKKYEKYFKANAHKKAKIIKVYEEDHLLNVETEAVELSLNLHKGLTINELIYKNAWQKPLVGTLWQGYYKDISLGADFFSGHAVIEKPARRKITDLSSSAYKIKNNEVQFHVQDGELSFSNEIKLLSNGIEIRKKIQLPKRSVARIHLFHFTFFRENWDLSTLYYAAHNGGKKLEYFHLTETNVEHSKLYSILISAKNGLGATEGIIEIGDQNKKLIFKHNPAECAIIPQITFSKNQFGEHFFRLHYSAQEYDETFKTSAQPFELNSGVTLTAEKNRAKPL
jgi:hypothetical protein